MRLTHAPYTTTLSAQLQGWLCRQSRPTGTAGQVNDAGVPLCPAGLPMRRHSADSDRHRIYYNCPLKHPTRRAGQLQWVADVAACPRQVLCQPDTQMGPVVYVRAAEDPRLYPPIPRESATFKALMARRTGCERSNSLKKETYRLGERPCRSAPLHGSAHPPVIAQPPLTLPPALSLASSDYLSDYPRANPLLICDKHSKTREYGMFQCLLG